MPASGGPFQAADRADQLSSGIPESASADVYKRLVKTIDFVYTRAMSAILVTGGTGTLGRALVPLLTAAGHQVRVLSRRPQPAGAEPGSWVTGDLRRGKGLAAAVAGVNVIVHCATSRRARSTTAYRRCRRTGRSAPIS